MIRGTGIDIMEVPRMKVFLERRGDKARERLFTPEEVKYCERKARAEQSYAARFAAKEAVMKMLGTGWSGGVRWRDIEVVRGKGGPPWIRLAGAAAARAEKLGIRRIHLSLTHTGEMAMAQVIGEGE